MDHHRLAVEVGITAGALVLQHRADGPQQLMGGSHRCALVAPADMDRLVTALELPVSGAGRRQRAFRQHGAQMRTAPDRASAAALARALAVAGTDSGPGAEGPGAGEGVHPAADFDQNVAGGLKTDARNGFQQPDLLGMTVKTLQDPGISLPGRVVENVMLTHQRGQLEPVAVRQRHAERVAQDAADADANGPGPSAPGCGSVFGP